MVNRVLLGLWEYGLDMFREEDDEIRDKQHSWQTNSEK